MKRTAQRPLSRVFAAAALALGCLGAQAVTDNDEASGELAVLAAVRAYRDRYGV